MPTNYERKTNQQLQDDVFLLEKQTKHIMEQVAGIKVELERRRNLQKEFYAAQVAEVKRLNEPSDST